MNRFDDFYFFSIATVDDVDDIMAFYMMYWAGNKIFAYDRDFLKWMYGLPDSETITFILAREKTSGKLAGVLGFVSLSPILEAADIFGAGLQVADNVLPMLGTELDKRLTELVPYRTYHSIGMHEDTSFILAKRVFHRRVGYMSQYYRLNKDIQDYKIARVVNRTIPDIIKDQDAGITRLYTIDEMRDFYGEGDTGAIPYKSSWYLEHRFYEHPVYDYMVYGADSKRLGKAVLVFRKVEVNDSRVLRMVDCIGKVEALTSIGDFADTLLRKMECEYIDFYCTGISDEVMNQIGFVRREKGDVNIIPNWFEPFEQRNIEITFATATEEDVVFCRADADMDRPNWGYY